MRIPSVVFILHFTWHIIFSFFMIRERVFYDTLLTYSLRHENYNCAPASSCSLVTKQLSFAEGFEVESVSGSTKEDFTLRS